MNSNLPSRIEAWNRLQQAGPDEWVLRHCRAVEALAGAMGEQASRAGRAIDQDLVLRGGLLHDIGRSVTHDVSHAYIGADLLRAANEPEELSRVVETHTGAGLEPDEAATAGLPVRDYMPKSLEEKLVAHADNLYSGDQRLSLAQLEQKYRAKNLPRAWEKIEKLHAELSEYLDCDLEELQPLDLPDIV